MSSYVSITLSTLDDSGEKTLREWLEGLPTSSLESLNAWFLVMDRFHGITPADVGAAAGVIHNERIKEAEGETESIPEEHECGEVGQALVEDPKDDPTPQG